MFFVWGTYQIARTATGAVEHCQFCGQDAVDRRVYERIGHFFFAPLVPRKFRLVTVCAHCQRTRTELLTRALAPRRIALGRIAIAWAAIGVLIALGAIAGVVTLRKAKEHAGAPMIGDQWTIDTRAWHELGTDLPDVDRYIRVRVDHVPHGGVVASMCDYTAADQDVIERKCHAFPHPIGTIDAGEVSRMRAGDVIVSVWRGGNDPAAAFFGAIGAVVLALFGFGLFTRRWAKRRRFEGPPVPEARVVR